jgi:thiol-disulfide isomerase/thioredoxin
MAPSDKNPRAPRPVLGILALAGAALVAVLAWKAWQVTQEADALARGAPAARAPAPPPPAPEVPYGQIVTTARPIPAPPVELATATGERFSLATARGRVVMLNFWATWCPPCAKEMPSMVALGEALAREHPGKFQMVAVSVDDSADLVKDFFSKPPWGGLPRGVTVVMEPGAGEVTRRYYCEGRGACGPNDVKFPESYFVDREGRIVAFVVGDMDWSKPAARAYLEALIRG